MKEKATYTGLYLAIICAGAVALLLVAVPLAIAIENWRGEKAWEAYALKAKERGIPLERASFAPQAVPDEENFAKAPKIEELTEDWDYHQRWRAARVHLRQSNKAEWRNAPFNFNPTKLKAALKPLTEELNEIAAALERPSTNFGLDYTEGSDHDCGHRSPLSQAADLYTLRAMLSLREGATAPAHLDIKTLFALSERIYSDPSLCTQRTNDRILSHATQALWEGIQSQQWSEEELGEVQSLLGKTDPLSQLKTAISHERTYRNEKFASEGSDISGWILQNKITYNHYIDRWEAAFDWKERVVHPFPPNTEKKFHPYRFIAIQSFDGFSKDLRSALATQTRIDFATVACALERHRLAHGAFPEHLDALVPAYVEKLPCDLFTGKPLTYRRGSEGDYLLYSAGWNQIDENATPSNNESEEGDWVWKISSRLQKH